MGKENKVDGATFASKSKEYEAPDCKVILLESESIICASDFGTEDGTTTGGDTSGS